MPIVVNSPYSGQPVKIRDQDIGRAVRDEQGRIFYVLPRSDNQGYYSAMTRVGGPKDEQRYLEMEEKMKTARQLGQVRSQQQIHDMTGKKRRSPARQLLVLVLLLVLVAVAIWLVRDQLPFLPSQPTGSPVPQAAPAPTDSTPPAPLENGSQPPSSAPADPLGFQSMQRNHLPAHPQTETIVVYVEYVVRHNQRKAA